jgi:hypothetical protein
MHKLLHIPEIIKRLGRTEHYHSNFFESDHSKVKGDYKRTSRRVRTVTAETVSQAGP